MKFITLCFDSKDYGWLKCHFEMVALDPVIFTIAALLKIPKLPNKTCGLCN